MEPLISKDTWAKFTLQEKQNVRKFIKGYDKTTDNAICDEINRGIGQVLTDVFGKENIAEECRVPKTWEEVVELFPDSNKGMDEVWDSLFYVGQGMLGDLLRKKILATIKLGRLMELGYGRFTYGQQDDSKERRFYIDIDCSSEKLDGLTVSADTSTEKPGKRLLSFINYHQAKEFLTYESNVRLVKDYFMMPRLIKDY